MKKVKDQSFAQLMEELEEISNWIESDQSDLEVSLEKFERGLAITKELQDRLDKAEQKINRLTRPQVSE